MILRLLSRMSYFLDLCRWHTRDVWLKDWDTPSRTSFYAALHHTKAMAQLARLDSSVDFHPLAFSPEFTVQLQADPKLANLKGSRT